MAASLSALYRAGRETEAAALEASYDARRVAFNAHPFARALDTVSEASMVASERGCWKLKRTDFQNGHQEVCVWRHLPTPRDTLERAIDRDLGHKADRGEGDLEANKRRAVRRAKQKVRHLCKSMRVNSLWTLTYRANVQDRELVLRHLDAFRRRVSVVLGEWRYIAVLEKQERGAFHIHLATHALPKRLVSGKFRLKSWDLMRSIWRSVVGDLGGNFDESKAALRFQKGTRRDTRRRMRAGAIAAYIAGYVAKDMIDSELNRKRYSCSKGVDAPAVEVCEFAAEEPLVELLKLAYAVVGERLTRSWFDPISQVFFVESDDSVPVG